MDQRDDNDSDTEDEDFDVNEARENIDSDDSYETFDENDNECAKEEEYTGPILPGGHRFDKKLLCIRYPGVVENPDRAIETLGGLAAMSGVRDTPNRRMELRFRPRDAYCKPTYGDRHEAAGFLLRVRVKKSRILEMERKAEEELSKRDFKGPYDIAELERMLGNLGKKDEPDEERKNISRIDERDEEAKKSSVMMDRTDAGSQVAAERKDTEKSVGDYSTDEDYRIPSAKVLGRVDTKFDFRNLCDFQFLAIGRSMTDPKVEEYIYDSVCPVDIPPYRWLKNKTPYFLPPASFSRTDTVQHLSLKPENDKGPKNVIGKTRKRLVGFSHFINFDSPETPCEPPSGIEVALKIKFLQRSHIERIREKFEERPVWSKNALMYVTKFSKEQLKFLLPSVAYYFMTGPWRIMWVKLGYDPRKDPQARKYQIFDYRLRAMHGLEYTVSRKRALSEYKLTPGLRPRTAILMSLKEDEGASQKKDESLNETVYIYREGVVPPWRQMFYQYCDVHVPEIQGMLAKLPDHLPPGVKCHEKRGWLPSGFSDQCREIINRQVRAVLRKQMNIPENHPTALPSKWISKKNRRLNRFAGQDSTKRTARRKRKEPKPPEQQLSESAEATTSSKSSNATRTS